jgi:hypothetical protein
LDIPAVGLDVDGVLADFTGYVLRKLDQDPSRQTTWAFTHDYGADINKKAYAMMDDPATWVSLKVLPGAVESVSLLVQAGVIPVFITSIPARFKDLRRWWIEAHFGPQLGRNPVYLEVVKHMEDKPDAALEYGLTHFVEDRRENANMLAEAGLVSILVPSSYQKDGPIHPAVVTDKTLLEFASEVASDITPRH